LNPHDREAELALIRLSQKGLGRACAAGAGNFSTDEHKKPESTPVRSQ